MNHQPFEDWLLGSTTLDATQKLELDAHLKNCTYCSSLAEVEGMLNSPLMKSPQTGFSNRFQERLLAERKLRRVRTWQGLGFLILCAFVLLGLAGFFVMRSVWANPVQVFIGWLSWWLNLVVLAKTFGSIVLVLIKVVATFIPIPMWVALLSAGCLLVLGWVMTLWKLSYSKYAGRLV